MYVFKQHNFSNILRCLIKCHKIVPILTDRGRCWAVGLDVMHLATTDPSWQSAQDGRGYAQQDDLNPGSCVTFNQPATVQQMIAIFAENNSNASWTQRLTQSHGPAVGTPLPRKADHFCPRHFIGSSWSGSAAAAQNVHSWLAMNLCLQSLPGNHTCEKVWPHKRFVWWLYSARIHPFEDYELGHRLRWGQVSTSFDNWK